MQFLTTTLALLATASAVMAQSNKVPGTNPLTYCSANQARDIVKISDVEFEPNPPVRGQALTIIANGTSKEPIQPGDFIQLNVKWGWVTAVNEKLDICQKIKENLKIDCPTSQFSFKHTVDLPASMPRGNYILKADARQADGDQLSCLGSELHF